MPTPFTKEQIYQNVVTTYHPTLERVLNTFIRPNEYVFAAATGSLTFRHADNYGKHIVRAYSFHCLIVITTYRWIRASMEWNGGIERLTYKQDGSRLGHVFGEPYYRWQYVFPPTRLPDPGKQSLSERIGEDIIEIPFSELATVRTRHDYSVTHNGQQLDLVELYFDEDPTWYAFPAKDGNLIYSLLQTATNHGRIPLETPKQGGPPPPPPTTAKEDPVQKLQQLQKLYEAKLISPAEYQAKRAEILSRI